MCSVHFGDLAGFRGLLPRRERRPLGRRAIVGSSGGLTIGRGSRCVLRVEGFGFSPGADIVVIRGRLWSFKKLSRESYPTLVDSYKFVESKLSIFCPAKALLCAECLLV